MLNNPKQELNEEIVEDSEGITETASEDQDVKGHSEETEDQEEELFYQIDGEEISLEEIKKWKAGHMMQSDYTKGKQEVAEKRRALDEMSAKTAQKIDELSSLESRLEKLIMEDIDEEKIDELLDFDSIEYLKAKKKSDTRKAKLSDIRKEITSARETLSYEASRQLFNKLGWDNNQDKYKADSTAIDKYRRELGINDHRFGAIVDPEIMIALLEASKYRALKTSNPGQVKKVTKTAVSTRPKTPPPKPLTLAERMYGKKP